MLLKIKLISSILLVVLAVCLLSFNAYTETKSEEGDNPVVLIKTNKGNIKVELNREKAPVTVDNFLSYVNDGFYNNTIFHRVIKGFMIQAGGVTKDLKQKDSKPPIKNEANNGLKNIRGSIAMGRTAAVDSATSHFFINQADNPFLDHGVRDFGYAVFGNVTEGMDVVDEIANVKTNSADVPLEPVIIESITVVK